MVLIVCVLLATIFTYYLYGEITSVASTEDDNNNNIEEKLLNTATSGGSAIGVVTSPSTSNCTKNVVFAAMSIFGCNKETRINYDAIFISEKIPLWLRILFPVVAIACVATVTASNMLLIASVMVEVKVGEEISIEPGSLLDFSLGGTVHDM